MNFAQSATAAGMELVAICDTWEERLGKAGAQVGVATYVEYDGFLGHEMDAVILANYFHQHAPLMVVTDTVPVEVNALSIARSDQDALADANYLANETMRQGGNSGGPVLVVSGATPTIVGVN
jgi:hypothetical protein